MKIPIYHIDAFTDTIFTGNPAAVCILEKWLPDETLNAIAKENNLPVTAFLVREKDKFNTRWITPEYELELCGHGSLASGFVIFNYLEPTWQKIPLQSKIELLTITRDNDFITLNFPAKNIEKVSLPSLSQGLGSTPQEIYGHKNDRCIAVFESEDEIRKLNPDIQALKLVGYRGITVTAPGKKVDFVSRTFYPFKTISEDPATGASHCLLAPYWAKRLNKNKFHALQVSQRGGEMFCEYKDERVFISSKAVLYSNGFIVHA